MARGSIAPKLIERIVFTLLFLATVAVIIPVGIVLFLIIRNGIGALSWEFLTTMPRMGMREGGIFPAMVGTLYLVLGTLIVALPIGIGAAIYLVEYARESAFRRMIEIAIVNLAGVPSVVYGLFGMGLFVGFLHFGSSILSGSLTLAVMTLPVIITSSREALQAVPRSFREVSLSLGASRWETIRYAVLPHAIPGILTGTILGLSRAAGETAPILFTVAAFYLPRLPRSIFDQAMALPYHLYVVSTQIPNIRLSVQYGTALVLVGIVLILNFTAIVVRTRLRLKRSW